MHTKTKGALALWLAIIMLIGIFPMDVLAEGVRVGTKDAAPPIEATTGANAKNAVHGFVGVQVGGDINLPLKNVTGQQFTPKSGVRVFFQWSEDGASAKERVLSPVYTTVSGADGQFHMAIEPFMDANGKLRKFDADPTTSAGHEKYSFWYDEDTIPEGYQVQYITGKSTVFPTGILTVTQGGSSSNTAKNTHNNWKVLLSEIPKNDVVHKTPAANSAKQWGGYIYGRINWDYVSDAGGTAWKFLPHKTTPASGVKVNASYLSDYAMKKIFSDEAAVALGVGTVDKIRGTGWSAAKERALQNWIKEQMALEGEKDKWIAETVQAETNGDGEYTLQFHGTWGPERNKAAATYEAPSTWLPAQRERVGTVADKATDGGFGGATIARNKKHINYDFLYVSTEGTEGIRVMSPYNTNAYMQMQDNWGIHSGWSGAGFGVGVTNALRDKLQADFSFGIGEVDFQITNYDTDANTAIPGDVAKTSTTGLPHSFTEDTFKIVWYDQAGNVKKTETAQKPDGTGSIPEASLDTTGVTETTTYTAKLYRVEPKDTSGKSDQLIAQDAFTVVADKYISSMYEDVDFTHGGGEKGVTYSAEGLPKGLAMDATGKVTGKAEEAGLFKVKVLASSEDKDAGTITAEKYVDYMITDTPLKDAILNESYTETAKPVELEGYSFKNIQVEWITQPEGLAISETSLSGTPTQVVKATQVKSTEEPVQMGPNVKVTYDIYRVTEDGEVPYKVGQVDQVPLIVKNVPYIAYYEDQTVGDDIDNGETLIVSPILEDKASGSKLTEMPEGTSFALADGAPAGVTIDPSSGAITYTKKLADAGKTLRVPVKITYDTGEEDLIYANISVEKSQAMTYDPQGQDITVDQNDSLNPADGIKNKVDMPEGTEYTFKEPVDTTELGNKPAIVVVTYPDGSRDEVPILVKVDGEPPIAEPDFTAPLAPTKAEGVYGGNKVSVSLPKNSEDGSAETDFEIGDTVRITKPDPDPENEGNVLVIGEHELTAEDLEKIQAGEAIDVTLDEGQTLDKSINYQAYVQDAYGNSSDPVAVSLSDPQDKDKYDPSYPDVEGTPGQEVTTDPSFTGANGDPAAAPQGISYQLGQGAPEGASVDTKTGRVYYSVPEGGIREDVTIPVVVTYPDGSIDTVDAKVTAPQTPEKSASPEVTAPKAGDKSISGTGEAGAEITVTLPGGKTVTATVGEDGTWTADVPEDVTLAEDDTVSVTQTETGKAASEPTTKTVGAADPQTPEKSASPEVTAPKAG
ncbi:MAG: YPDG domain-containing protein, partial [Tissierellia bacterium]|nr:YPDG domain-containing protein [Tissierellia bacterium]